MVSADSIIHESNDVKNENDWEEKEFFFNNVLNRSNFSMEFSLIFFGMKGRKSKCEENGKI